MLCVLRMADRGQFDYELWEPFLTPDYVQALLVDGLLKTLQMAFFSVILAVVFGTIFGVGKLSDHAQRALAVLGWSWSSSAPCRC